MYAGHLDVNNRKRDHDMDLGIAGRWAIVCASSRGLGLGCAEALAGAGVNLVMNGRRADVLASAADNLRRQHSVDIREVVADVVTGAGREAILGACPQVDILVTNAGGPPPGIWSDWSRDDFIAALDANMLAPISMMQKSLPGMMDRGWGRVVNITSMSVKAPIAVLGLSNSARTGLTGFVAGTSRQVAPHGVTINNLLPGIHATDRAVSLDNTAAATEGLTAAEVKNRREQSIPVKRYGTPGEFGATCAFLCSVHAAFIVGQNILHDGGAINSTM